MGRDSGADGGDELGGGTEPPALPAMPVHIPDDARALEPDRLEWLREVAAEDAARRRSHRRTLGRRLLGRRWERYGIAGSVVVLLATLVTAVGSLALFLGPRLTPTSRVLPLATPKAAVGQRGGLLPDSLLRTGRGALAPVRDLRPVVLALVPPGCACAALLRDVHQQVDEFSVPMWLVAADGHRAEIDALAPAAGSSTFNVLEDVGGALAATYRGTAEPTRPVLVLVHVDGVVRAVTEAAGVLRLEPELARLGARGAK